jgi:hypothetical protein
LTDDFRARLIYSAERLAWPTPTAATTVCARWMVIRRAHAFMASMGETNSQSVRVGTYQVIVHSVEQMRPNGRHTLLYVNQSKF